MEIGLFESRLYAYSLLKRTELIEKLEKGSEDLLSKDTKKIISDFYKEFNSPVVAVDIEHLKDYEKLFEIYKKYKKELKGIWSELWNIVFFKISDKIFKRKANFETGLESILNVKENFEFIDLSSISEILHEEGISHNLFIVFLSFIIYELKKFGLFEKLDEKEKEIALRYVSWNPRLSKILSIKEEKKEEITPKKKEEIIKFFNDKLKELKDIVNKKEIDEIPDILSREFTKILRFCAITVQETKKTHNLQNFDIFPDNHIYYLLKFYKLYEGLKPDLKDIIKDLTLIFAEGYKIFKGEKDVFFKNFIEKKILGIDLKMEEFYSKMTHFFNNVLQKIFDYKLLEKKILLHPYEKIYEDDKKENHFIYFSLIPNGAFVKLKDLKRVKIKIEHDKKFENFIRRNQKVVSILVYDIRGSTFMSLSLFNANKELSIKKKFQEMMKSIIISNGGFPVKETGDGGIAFFSENARELYMEIYEETVVSGQKMRFQKALSEFKKIKPFKKAGERALLCAIEMLEKSEEFIRKNYPEYRGWFPDVLGKDSPLKSLFRLGIGIFSGEEGRDIFLSFNAFGDFDIQGPASNLASILSEIRFPDVSSILMDINTFANLLLNSEIVEIVQDIKEYDIKDLMLIKKEFKIKNKNFKIKNFGFLDLEEANKLKIFKQEGIKNIEFDTDFIKINGKKGVPVYGGKR